MNLTTKEQMQTALEAYHEHASPTALETEQAGESIDSQLAIQGLKSIAESKKAHEAELTHNYGMVKAVMSVLPTPNFQFDIDDTDSLVVARKLQSRVIFEPVMTLGGQGNYIIGSRTRGRKTALLLANCAGVEDSLPIVPTRLFSRKQAEAKSRETQEFTTEDLQQMQRNDETFRLSRVAESCMRLACVSSVPSRIAYTLSRGRIGDSDPYDVPTSNAILMLDRVDLSDFGGLSDAVLQQFDVVNHLAEITSAVGVADEAVKKLSLLEEK